MTEFGRGIGEALEAMSKGIEVAIKIIIGLGVLIVGLLAIIGYLVMRG